MADRFFFDTGRVTPSPPGTPRAIPAFGGDLFGGALSLSSSTSVKKGKEPVRNQEGLPPKPAAAPTTPTNAVWSLWAGTSTAPTAAETIGSAGGITRSPSAQQGPVFGNSTIASSSQLQRPYGLFNGGHSIVISSPAQYTLAPGSSALVPSSSSAPLNTFYEGTVRSPPSRQLVIAGNNTQALVHGPFVPTMPAPPRMDVRVPAQRAVHFGSYIIMVHVGTGEDTKKFALHGAFVCPRSRFFLKAMNRSSDEAKDQIVQLPDQDPATFSLYEQLLYVGWLPTRAEEDDRQEEYLGLCKLYALGAYLEDNKAMNAAVDAVLACWKEPHPSGMKQYPSIEAIHVVYRTPAASNPAKRLLVDIFAYNGNSTWLADAKLQLPFAFVCDLAGALYLLRYNTLGTDLVSTRDSIYYHVPEEQDAV